VLLSLFGWLGIAAYVRADFLRNRTLDYVRAARALGIDDRVGTLAPGKRADMTAVNLDALELSPCYDPLSHLVYAAGREHVSHVWVDGELAVERGQLTRLDSRELAAKAAYWKDKIRS